MIKAVDPKELMINPFELIDDEWFLIVAGSPEHFNMMTASWGGMGILWNKNVFTCYVRPTRHTYSFMEENTHFSISFFGRQHRKALNYCGKYSGRDVNKVKETGLTPVFSEKDVIFFEQSKLMFSCRKLFHSDIDPAQFADSLIDKNYPLKDYHRVYIGEITACYINEE